MLSPNIDPFLPLRDALEGRYRLERELGAAFLVGSLWRVLRSVGGDFFGHLAWPLVHSALVLTVFALATEPESQRTKPHQKVQKGLITLANALLVYFTVVGGSVILAG